jgi:hypothetical protein
LPSRLVSTLRNLYGWNTTRWDRSRFKESWKWNRQKAEV